MTQSNKPAIILVHPQLAENIGMTARAMANCDLPELRIVKPREPWPLEPELHERMIKASSGAGHILENAILFETVKDAVADLNYVYATTARNHGTVNKILTPRGAIEDMKTRIHNDQKTGVMFGPERMGLISDYIALANAKITIPLNPEFTSLNLAQTVLLIGYEWFQAGDDTPDAQTDLKGTHPASQQEYNHFYKRLEEELDATGFFPTKELRPHMTRNLQSMLQRAAMTEQEIRTWHGVISALTGKKLKGREEN